MNFSIQCYSILTLIALANFQQRIDKASMQDDVIITNTIYDAIYLEVRNNPETISWVNTNLVEAMLTPYMINTAVPNAANLEIGTNLANLTELSNNATLDEISEILKDVKCKQQ